LCECANALYLVLDDDEPVVPEPEDDGEVELLLPSLPPRLLPLNPLLPVPPLSPELLPIDPVLPLKPELLPDDPAP